MLRTARASIAGIAQIVPVPPPYTRLAARLSERITNHRMPPARSREGGRAKHPYCRDGPVTEPADVAPRQELTRAPPIDPFS